jgi:hypothetical protein
LVSELADLIHGVKHSSGAVFSGALERVRNGLLTVRLADGRTVDAALPPSGDLAGAVISERYHLADCHLADQVQIECARTKTIFDAEAALQLHLAVKSIRLVRAATSQEQRQESARLSWRAAENLLKIPARFAVSSASAQAAMADLERVRKINLDRLSKMPDFIADETELRYHSEGAGQQWKLADTIESEVSVKDDDISHRNMRRNGVPLKQSLSKYPGPIWRGDFGIMLGTLDTECSFTFEFAGIAVSGARQLRAYRFMAPPGGCFAIGARQGSKNHQQYKPGGAGQILVDSRGDALRFEYEGSGFPETFPVDRVASSTAWDYVHIGGSSYLVPVATTFSTLHADGSGWLSIIKYRNHRHFEASASVTYSPGK